MRRSKVAVNQFLCVATIGQDFDGRSYAQGNPCSGVFPAFVAPPVPGDGKFAQEFLHEWSGNNPGIQEVVPVKIGDHWRAELASYRGITSIHGQPDVYVDASEGADIGLGPAAQVRQHFEWVTL